MSTQPKFQDFRGIGLHKGVPYETYDRWDAINHSKLRYFNRTAAHARAAIVEAPDQTEAQALGWAAHVAILEPERFESEFVAAPKIDKRTTAGKLEWQEFQAEHSGGSILTKEEYDLCIAMTAGVWAHPTAAELLRGPGLNEVSALWEDKGTGLKAKARLDRLTALAGWPCIVDVKTTRNASRASFAKDLHAFHYHQQAAFYLDGLNALAPHDRKFIFIAVEKEPPYCAAVYEIDEDALQIGRDDVAKHLDQYAECLRTNRWPGYADGMDYVSLPPWAFRPTQGE